MTEQKFIPGDRVRITLEATYSASWGYESHGFDIGSSGVVWLDQKAVDSCVERLAPANWPPQAGDVWSDEKSDSVTGPHEWHALRNNPSQVRMLSAASVGVSPDEFLRSYPNARLVHKGLARPRAEEEES